jgi:hypothetical protein
MVNNRYNHGANPGCCSLCCFSNCKTNSLKGQCHEIFNSGFFHQTTSPCPVRKDFEFFRIFKELFVFVIDSPVYSPLGSRDSPIYSSPGSRFNDFKEHTTIFTGTIILKINCGPL